MKQGYDRNKILTRLVTSETTAVLVAGLTSYSHTHTGQDCTCTHSSRLQHCSQLALKRHCEWTTE